MLMGVLAGSGGPTGGGDGTGGEGLGGGGLGGGGLQSMQSMSMRYVVLVRGSVAGSWRRWAGVLRRAAAPPDGMNIWQHDCWYQSGWCGTGFAGGADVRSGNFSLGAACVPWWGWRWRWRQGWW
jgi:hypothetical protein